MKERLRKQQQVAKEKILPKKLKRARENPLLRLKKMPQPKARRRVRVPLQLKKKRRRPSQPPRKRVREPLQHRKRRRRLLSLRPKRKARKQRLLLQTMTGLTSENSVSKTLVAI
ncbi:MAG: hypothetical protein GY841_03800 [FCB group bacterium]|nr:hypothetical protein [FCB group bacterium]